MDLKTVENIRKRREFAAGRPDGLHGPECNREAV